MGVTDQNVPTNELPPSLGSENVSVREDLVSRTCSGDESRSGGTLL